MNDAKRGRYNVDRQKVTTYEEMTLVFRAIPSIVFVRVRFACSGRCCSASVELWCNVASVISVGRSAEDDYTSDPAHTTAE